MEEFGAWFSSVDLVVSDVVQTDRRVDPSFDP